MWYETYKLGKQKKRPARRGYTREELESMELPRLREIGKAEQIKPPTLETLQHKEEMVELLYRYLGTKKEEAIERFGEKEARRLAEAFQKEGLEQPGGIEAPARLELTKGFDCLEEEGSWTAACPGEERELGGYAFLTGEGGAVQAILTLRTAGTGKYSLQLAKERMSPELPVGRFRDWNLLFLEPGAMEEALRRYRGQERKKSVLPYYRVRLPSVMVREALESEEPLVIDYGASYTTAGTFGGAEEAVERIRFPQPPECGAETDCGGCGLCPSVIAVKTCREGEAMTFWYGREAVAEETKRGSRARNSIFYDTKPWVDCYRERIEVTDAEGNTCEVERLELVRQFLLYVVGQAERQKKKRYPRLCFTCPVKQKARALRMYQEALPEYQVEAAVDEAVAVAYQSLAGRIRRWEYEDGEEGKVLILDCGGGRSDLVSCDYQIRRQAVTSGLSLRVTYAQGDPAFGGNHLTYRVFQLLKIRLAEHYRGCEAVAMGALFPGVYPELYETVDAMGTEAVYAVFENRYREAEAVVPTCFALYQNQPESRYWKARGNFYFLWGLAETVKKQLYREPGVSGVALRALFPEDKGGSADLGDYHVFVAAGETPEMHTRCPDLTVGKEEAQLLLKPEVYGFFKKFIEPWYADGRLQEVDRILLAGQSSRMDLFREVLKEYVPGRKAKGGGEKGCAGKWRCMEGAAAYRQDRRSGRIRSMLSYEAARAPYAVTAADYAGRGREKTLLEKGSPLGESYGYVSRPAETEEVVFRWGAEAGTAAVVPYTYRTRREERQETGYGELLGEYPFLLQGDIDSIREGELRIFVYTEAESWGCYFLEVGRDGGELYRREPSFAPFGGGEQAVDFFDGRR